MILRLSLLALIATPAAAQNAEEWHNFYGQELRTVFHLTDTWVRSAGRWQQLASQVTALPRPIAGKSSTPRVAREYAGRYGLTPDIRLTIAATDSGLMMTRQGDSTGQLARQQPGGLAPPTLSGGPGFGSFRASSQALAAVTAEPAAPQTSAHLRRPAPRAILPACPPTANTFVPTIFSRSSARSPRARSTTRCSSS